MSQQSLTILTPHARRYTVKLTPNTTLLEVLEQVCRKYQLDPNRHILKHHNKTVDLSGMFRFSGLPNNGLLEMEETDQVRQEAEVQIVLQTESGDRLSGSFPPTHSLRGILMSLCPASAELGANCVVIYMRKEVFGEELEKTTLKSLGLTSGKAMLRLLHRNPEELRVQANVSAPLVPKPTPGPSVEVSKSEERVQKAEEEPMEVEEIEMAQEKIPGGSMREEEQEVPEVKKLRFEGSAECETISAEEVKKLEEEIKIVGPNDAVIFSLDSTQRVQERDLPDSFFDLTVDDVRLLLRDLKDQVKGLDNAPLLTAKLRDMENDRKILKLLQYKKTVIRIQFPDRYVLQMTFNPIDTIQTVMDLIRKLLQSQETPFYLFTTPPKEVLPPNARLVELKCVPQAVIHFGVEQNAKPDSGHFLRQDLLENLTSPDAAVLQAMKCRGLPLTNSAELGQDSDQGTRAVAENPPNKPRVPDNFQKSSSSSSNTGVPKWFKLPK